MAIYRLVQNSPLDPDDIKVLTDAYEAVLSRLNLADRNDPITELIARKIFEIGQTGVRNSVEICERVVSEFADK